MKAGSSLFPCFCLWRLPFSFDLGTEGLPCHRGTAPQGRKQWWELLLLLAAEQELGRGDLCAAPLNSILGRQASGSVGACLSDLQSARRFVIFHARHRKRHQNGV